MINILLWKWKAHEIVVTPGTAPVRPKRVENYGAEHVNVMVKMLRRHLKGEHRIICITDDTQGIVGCETYPIWSDYNTLMNASGAHLPSCYRRLKMFDLPTLNDMGIAAGSRVASIDLDAVVVGSMDEVFNRKEDFVGWGVPGIKHQRVFNGSFCLFTAGKLQHLWSNFDPVESPKEAHAKGFFGSDQGWLSLNLAKDDKAGHWNYPVIASWPREVRRIGRVDNRNRIIFFHGADKPWHPNTLRMGRWIGKHWHMGEAGEYQTTPYQSPRPVSDAPRPVPPANPKRGIVVFNGGSSTKQVTELARTLGPPVTATPEPAAPPVRSSSGRFTGL